MIFVTKFRTNDLIPSKGKQIEFNANIVKSFFGFREPVVRIDFECYSLKDLMFKQQISATLQLSPARGDYKLYQNANGSPDLKDVFLDSLHLTLRDNLNDYYAIRKKSNALYQLFYIPRTALFADFFPKILGDQVVSADNEIKVYEGQILPHQLIVYGAPGTGKSHDIEEIVGAHDDTVRTTFHPDSDYATFVGCYKPTMVPQVKYGLQGKPIEQGGKEVTEEVIAYSYVPQAFTKAYVRAWRKMMPESGGTVTPQFLVIEEINRGNCAQIFGDLFQLLDRDGAHYSKYAIEADSDLAKYIAKELFSAPAGVPDEIRSGKVLKLPPNLYIWATMNTSDQSLFPMDSAFKRRWEWKYVPIEDKGKGWKIVADGAEFPWWGFIETVNKHILDTLKNEDKQLGYFFARPDDDAGDAIKASKFVNKVLFYLYNDVFKDYDLPTGFAKPDGKGKFAFRDFFLGDGKTNETAVKNLLTGLLARPQ